ncbi:MAG: sulfite exporter TauE/SafE family protein [Candidatus Accumulibacter sp.]|nr:sulfite exporter TauE/SafE family protein [Accumulibacter sp.]
MPEASYLALFLIGLLGGTHCVGMCGGIVGALSMGDSRLQFHLAYNAGRLLSYATAGAIVGALGQMSISLAGQWPLRNMLYLVANLMLIALGLYLIGIRQILGVIEGLGQSLWRRLQPLGKHLLPVRNVGQAFPLGVLWGWLPCGLVYSALTTALSSGSAWQGALLMLAFGTGTLPNLLLAGLLAARLRGYTRQPAVRLLAGGLICGFGVWGLLGSTRWLLSA